MSTLRWIAAGAAAAAAATTALLVASSPAGASAHCTAYGSLPARVSINSDHVVVHTVLRGSPACHGQMTDNGASAYLHAPSGKAEDLRWRHFGATQDVTFYASLTRPGTYTIKGGDVQIYDHTYRRVDSTWRTTTTVVKGAGRVRRAAARGGQVSGHELVYTKYGWEPYRHLVYVQRRAVHSTTWHTLGSTRPGAQGWATYRTATSSRYVYRLKFYGSTSYWGAASVSVRGS